MGLRLFFHCSDPRDRADLETKINAVLLAPGEKINRIAVYGGPIVLAHPIVFREEANTMLRQINFAIENFYPEEIVLVGHDCGFYSTVLSLAKLTLVDKKRDIIQIRKTLAHRHPQQPIKALFDVTQGEQVQFEHFAA